MLVSGNNVPSLNDYYHQTAKILHTQSRTDRELQSNYYIIYTSTFVAAIRNSKKKKINFSTFAMAASCLMVLRAK